jgi:hypothetical protein
MRKSAAVKLTLVPLLAASAMAYAQAPGMTDPSGAPIGATMPSQWVDTLPAAMEPVLSPPGMTPTIDELDCDTDPNADVRDDCAAAEGEGEGGVPGIVVRGGYGSYFWGGDHGHGG